MDYIKDNMLSIDLNDIYEAELHHLVRVNEALRVQNETLKLQLGAKQHESKSLRDEIKQLKTGYGEGNGSLILCSVIELCKSLDLVKRKHVAEMEKLRTELSQANGKLEDITSALYRERSLQIQAEAEKREVIEIAEELFGIAQQQQETHSFLNKQALKSAQPVSKELQKTAKEELLLEGLFEEMEELRAAETKTHISTPKFSVAEGGLQDKIIELQQQLQREAELTTEAVHVGDELHLKLGKIPNSRKLNFLPRYC